jgi:hypothetical protein
MPDAKQHAKLIKEEANKLLENTNLNALLAQFGKVELGGSYGYALMVDRDLDFGVAVKSVTPEIRAEIASLFASQPWAYSVKITDRINFEPLSNLRAPRGLFLGLTIPFPKERWNIDIWFIVEDKIPQDEMSQLIAKASQEQKDIILQIKYDLMRNGRKQKGLTSAEVYKAVLEHGVYSTEEFLKR